MFEYNPSGLRLLRYFCRKGYNWLLYFTGIILVEFWFKSLPFKPDLLLFGWKRSLHKYNIDLKLLCVQTSTSHPAYLLNWSVDTEGDIEGFCLALASLSNQTDFGCFPRQSYFTMVLIEASKSILRLKRPKERWKSFCFKHIPITSLNIPPRTSLEGCFYLTWSTQNLFSAKIETIFLESVRQRPNLQLELFQITNFI